MKGLQEYLKESLEEEVVTPTVSEGEEDGEIQSEEDFREYAENKFREVFADELDEEQMNETIEGLLEDNQDLVEAGEWGELVGMLNKSFGA